MLPIVFNVNRSHYIRFNRPLADDAADCDVALHCSGSRSAHHIDTRVAPSNNIAGMQFHSLAAVVALDRCAAPPVPQILIDRIDA